MGRTTELRREIKLRVNPLMAEKGFVCDMRHAPQFVTFRRVTAEVVHVFDIQWDKYGSPRFAVPGALTRDRGLLGARHGRSAPQPVPQSHPGSRRGLSVDRWARPSRVAARRRRRGEDAEQPRDQGRMAASRPASRRAPSCSPRWRRGRRNGSAPASASWSGEDGAFRGRPAPAAAPQSVEGLVSLSAERLFGITHATESPGSDSITTISLLGSSGLEAGIAPYSIPRPLGAGGDRQPGGIETEMLEDTARDRGVGDDGQDPL